MIYKVPRQFNSLVMNFKKYQDYYVEEVLPKDHFLFASESVGEGYPDKLCD
jgi:hypothetical protein